jgi:hypothetical protein
MSTRTIKLKVLTSDKLVSIETSARTFADFKADKAVQELGIDWSSATLIDRASKASFLVDDAVLPAINSIMFIMPTKSKAGSELSYKDAKEKILQYKEEGGDLKGFNFVGKSAKDLNEFYNSLSVPTKSISEKAKEIVGKAVKSVKQEVIGLIQNNWNEDEPKEVVKEVEVVREVGIPTDQLLDSTTLSDLSEEAKQLKSQLSK